MNQAAVTDLARRIRPPRLWSLASLALLLVAPLLLAPRAQAQGAPPPAPRVENKPVRAPAPPPSTKPLRAADDDNASEPPTLSADAERLIGPGGGPSTAPRYIIERIVITGQKRTRESTVRAHLLVEAGHVLDEQMVTLSRLKLLTLSLFAEVKTRLSRGSRKGYVVLHFEVVERNTIVVEELFIGSSTRAPFWAGFGVSDMNFLGLGHTLHGAFVVSSQQQAYRLDYFAPTVPGTALTLGAGLLYSKGLEFFPVTQGETAQTADLGGMVDYERYGGYLSVGYKLGAFNRFMVDLRGEGLRAFVGSGVAQPPLARGHSRLFALAGYFERDARDRPFVPTRGHRLRVGVELGSELLGGSYNYSKYTWLWEQSIPTFAHHAFRFDLRAGLVQGDAPFFNKFFFGDTSFFSFRDRALPRALGLNFSKETVYDEVLLSAGLEYAVPVFRGNGPFYRGFVYLAGNATYTASLDETLGRKERPGGRTWTLSFDLGFKLDTTVGVFTFSLAYLLDYAL